MLHYATTYQAELLTIYASTSNSEQGTYESASSSLAQILVKSLSSGQVMSYRSFVAAKSQRRSRLQNLSNFLDEDTACQHACRIDCVEFSGSSRSPNLRSLHLDQLASILYSNARDKDLFGRLLIIEDVAPDLVEMLGSALDINPLFFASHIDTAYNDIRKGRASTATLPSTIRSQNFLNLHYQRVIEFDNAITRKRLLRDMNLGRKVKMLPKIKGKSFGLVRHCCSMLQTVSKDGLWLGTTLLAIYELVLVELLMPW